LNKEQALIFIKLLSERRVNNQQLWDLLQKDIKKLLEENSLDLKEL